MKKLLFTLPFLLFSVTGCANNSTIGKLSKLKVEEVEALTIFHYSFDKYEVFRVENTKLKDVAKEVLNLKVKISKDACKCISNYYFYITGTNEKHFEFDAYSFHEVNDESKYTHFTAEDSSYSKLVDYALESSYRVS